MHPGCAIRPILILILCLGVAHSQRQPNDDFEEATMIEGADLLLVGDTSLATTQVGERKGIRSLWWKWISPEDGVLQRVDSSRYLYTDILHGLSLEELTLVPWVRHQEEFQKVKKGRTYYLRVTDPNSEEIGQFQSRVQFVPLTASSDSIEEAPVLESLEYLNVFTAFPEDSTVEEGEPNHELEDTVSRWFRWSPPTSRPISFYGSSAYVNRFTFVVYEDGGDGELKKVEINDHRAVPLRENGNYLISMVVRKSEFPDFEVFRLVMKTSLPNSGAENAESIDALPYLSDSRVDNERAQEWWKWEVDRDRNVEFSAKLLSEFHDPKFTQVNVYRGDSVDLLDQIGRASGGKVVLSLLKGETYWFEVFGNGRSPWNSVQVEMRESDSDYPSNHQFADAVDLPTGLNSIILHGRIGGPALEMGAPDPLFYSVWYRWVPPLSGRVTGRVGYDSSLRYQLLSGSSLENLIVSERNLVKAGDPYFLKIGKSENLALRENDTFVSLWIEPETVSKNDDFENRCMLGAEFPMTLSGDSSIATVDEEFPEAGETLWYGFTVEENGITHFSRQGNGNLFVYEFREREWFPIAESQSARGSFHVKAETEYAVGVAGREFDYYLRLFPMEARNTFEARVKLPSEGFVRMDRPILDVLESSLGRDRWWEWTAPKNGIVDLIESGWSEVYIGNDLENLTEIAKGRNLRFDAVGGQTYLIAGDSRGIRLVQIPSWNDMFSERIKVSGDHLEFYGHNQGATSESGESRGHSNSVWWEWVADSDEPVEIRVESLTSSKAYLRVYEGPASRVRDLNLAKVDSQGYYLPSAGKPLYISVDNTQDIGFQVQISHRNVIKNVLELNDDFKSASDLGSAVPTGSSGELRASTVEEFEPIPRSGMKHSLWWKWTSPANGVYRVESSDPKVPHQMPRVARYSIYEGSELPDLTKIARRGNYFFAAKGKEVYIQMTASLSATELKTRAPIGFTIEVAPPVSKNDDFQESLPFPSRVPGVVVGSALLATAEPGEPFPPGWEGARTLWWHWLCEETGDYVVSSENAVAIYTGERLEELEERAVKENYGALHFQAEAGIMYRIASMDRGLRTHTVSITRSSPNDLFSNRAVVVGDAFLLQGDLARATSQLDDGDWRDLWWEWTAPESGRLVFEHVEGECREIRFYQEGELEDLGTFRVLSAPSSRDRPVQSVDRGVTYYIAVGDREKNSFEFRASLQSETLANDRFSSAMVLEITDTHGIEFRPQDTTVEMWEIEKQLASHSAKEGSIWFKWEAPYSGNYGLSLSKIGGNDIDGFRKIQILAAVSLSLQAGGSEKILFEADEGEEFYFRLSGQSSDDLFRFSIEPVQLNSQIEDAVELLEFGEIKVGTPNLSAELNEGDELADEGWWKWTAREDGNVTFETLDGEPIIRRYVQLSPETLVFQQGLGKGNYSFAAIAGSSYFFKVRSRSVHYARIVQTETLPKRAENDDFDSRFDLGSDIDMNVIGDFTESTFELGEWPRHPSLWWKWKAPGEGRYRLRRFDRDISIVVEGFKGNTLPDLISLGNEFDLSAGEEIAIRARSTNGITYQSKTVEFTIEGIRRGTLNNDDFDQAVTLIPGLSIEFDNIGATAEAGEPKHGGSSYADHSVWFKWVADSDTQAFVHLSGAPGLIAIFEGHSMYDLDRIIVTRREDPGKAFFDAKAGRTYHVAIAGPEFLYKIRLETDRSIANNRIEESISVQMPFKVAVETENSGFSSGDPPIARQQLYRTVWWRWACHESGDVELSCNSVFGIFEKLEDQLILVAEKRRGGNLEFSAAAGSEYFFLSGYWNYRNSGIVELAGSYVEKPIPLFDRWISEFQLGEEEARQFADPDGDGWSNREEWLFGTSPLSGNSFPRVAIEGTRDGRIELSYDRPTELSETVIYRYWMSDNLINWSQIEPIDQEQIQLGGGITNVKSRFGFVREFSSQFWKVEARWTQNPD